MLVTQQSSLRFEEGKSNKVYEVDLIDLQKNEDQQYLVNFRYGRFGSNLREGTKTVSPITLEKAQSIYASLVVSKVNKGYIITSGFDPISGKNINHSPASEKEPEKTSPVTTPDIQSEPQRVNDSLLKRQSIVHEKFLNHLKHPEDFDKLNKCLWRLGELKAVQAVPSILNNYNNLPTNNDVLNYTVAWTLGRCRDNGGDKATELLNNLIESKPSSNVKRMAIHALFHISSPTEQKDLYKDYETQLADALRSIISSDNEPQALSERILIWAERNKSENGKYKKNQRDPQIDITYLYLLSKKDKKLRKVILTLCTLSLFSFGRVWLVRLLFKIAEFELDSELLAVLTKQIEKSKALYYQWGKKEYASTYSDRTRDYFRRRTWRLLRRLGEIEDENYVNIASELLLQYDDNTIDDEDKAFKSQVIKYDWDSSSSTYSTEKIDYHFPDFATHTAFNQILYRESEHIRPVSSKCRWQIKNAEVETKRTEAFSDLWNKQTHKFLYCLKESESQTVHNFALKGLTDNKDFCQNINIDDWAILLKTPYANTALFAQKQIERNHPAVLKDLTFLRSLIPAKTQEARLFMQSHLGRISEQELYENTDWLVDLIISEYRDNRKYAAEFFYSHDLPKDKIQLVLAKTISFVLNIGTNNIGTNNTETEFPLEQNHWDKISKTILEPLASASNTLSFDIVRDLITHQYVEIQRLGGKILVLQKHQPENIPNDIFMALIESEDGEMRSLGVRLLSNLKDDELTEMPDFLVSLLVSNDELVRKESRAIIQRVASNNSRFSEQILNDLTPYVFKAESTEGQHDTLVECMSEDLKNAWPTINKDLLWRLLMAQSKAAQRVGAAILMDRPYQNYSVRQWSHLAKHATKNVRNWACDAYTKHKELVQEQFPSALRILDNDWDDSRVFAIDYFRQHFNADDTNSVWTPDNLILLCDSVRDDVQRLGRDLLRQFFKEEQGEAYLLKLSQHPNQNIQLFASEFLQNYAGDNVETIEKLHDYFITVLSGVNKGRVTKKRVLEFLLKEANKSKDVAKQLSLILERQSVTVAIQDKASFIAAMLGLQNKYPDLNLPIQQKSLAIRGYGNDKHKILEKKTENTNNSEVA